MMTKNGVHKAIINISLNQSYRVAQPLSNVSEYVHKYRDIVHTSSTQSSYTYKYICIYIKSA